MPVQAACLSLVLDASDLESSKTLRIRCGGMIEKTVVVAEGGTERALQSKINYLATRVF